MVDFRNLFESVDENAFKNTWATIEIKPLQFQISVETNINLFHQDKDIYNFLSFVKLFPSHKYKFDQALEALISFCDVCNKKFIYLPQRLIQNLC